MPLTHYMRTRALRGLHKSRDVYRLAVVGTLRIARLTWVWLFRAAILLVASACTSAPNDSSKPGSHHNEIAHAVHPQQRHPLEFPPNEWMAWFLAICVLILIVMTSNSVRSYIQKRRRQALAKRVPRTKLQQRQKAKRQKLKRSR
jgi:hypothetical protein